MLVDIKEFKFINSVEMELYQRRQLLFTRILNFQLLMAGLSVFFSCVSPYFLSEPSLPYPGWYPIDWRNDTTSYFVVFIYQFIGIIFVSHSIILMEAYAMYLMIVAGSHLDILANRLETLGHKMTAIDIFEIKRSFRIDCIQTYTKIARFQNLIERIFSIPIFIQFLISGAILCVTVFQIVTMDPGKDIANLIFYLCYCATICMEIFLPCYFGTELMLKNNNLTTAAYSSNWTEFPIYLQKLLVVFMEFTKKPRILLSGKLFSLSLNSFLVVLNRTYSLFAVLKNLFK
ncbi:odorant receptor 94b-like [Bradysia coprophila]|uniref:odorant receptor 94b-like n=1 Tax=Bradysia coprophila TaxID=38358 RepID=UPI00187D74C4|nr:odorant receptor 94b-like [Bradysia coprophila]